MQPSTRKGIFVMLLAAVCFSCSDVGVKVLGSNLSPWHIMGFRGLVGMLAILAAVKLNWRLFLVRHWPTQVLLGAACTFGYTGFIISIKLLPLSVALPLSYVFPALGALMSPLINKEKPSPGDWLAIGLALLAVVLLSRGAALDQHYEHAAWGVAAGLGGAVMVALMTNLARRQARNTLMSVNLFYLFFCNCLFGAVMCLFFDRPLLPPTADLARLLFFIAPMAVTAFWLMFIAYRHISAHQGGNILMTEAALATAYGLVALGEPFSLFGLLGVVLMLSSAVIIARNSM